MSAKTLSDFLDALRAEENLSPEDLRRVQTAISQTEQPVDVVIRELGILSEERFSASLAQFFEVEALPNLRTLDSDELLQQLGLDFALDHAIVPLADGPDCAELAIADPFDRRSLDAVSYFFGKPLHFLIAPRSRIEEFIRERMEPAASSVGFEDKDTLESSDVDRLADIAREAPVVRLVSRIIQKAVDAGATDIHIEPQENVVRVRFRIDGLLSVGDTAPKAMHAAIATRLKILARLNIAERRLSQDGRLRIAIRGQEIDFRLSVMPSVHGETIVLRILDRSNVKLDLQSLGYDPNAAGRLMDLATRPNGIVLISGPTGSGKTTTLYALLSAVNRSDLKIFTIEDPVEYRIDGITQLQVDPTIGLSFSSALRSVLRQDPDVILVGEIRDRETAQIAIQAALTGHLVLSTIHTNSAIGSIGRLKDMGIEPYLLEATLRGVISQRLLRRLCPHCAGETPPKLSCSECQGSGFTGRHVTYEILEISPRVRNLITRQASEGEIEETALSEGMQLLHAHARSLASNRITTAAEVARVVEFEGS